MESLLRFYNMSIYPTHKHHIIPRHAGGTDDPNNLVELTVEDHAIAHKVLYGLYGRWQDKVAWQGLSGIIGKEEIIRETQSASKKGKVWYNNGSESILTFEGEQPKGFIRGRKLSEETKAKISAARKGKKGKPHSEESKAKISAANKGKKGKPLSEEHKAKISAANKGKPLSEETKAKLSASLKGREFSEETRAKLSAARKGKPLSEETKAKLSASLKDNIPWNKGRKLSEEHKAKLSASLKGREFSEETRAKLSAARKGKKRGPYKKKHKAKISDTLRSKKV